MVPSLRARPSPKTPKPPTLPDRSVKKQKKPIRKTPKRQDLVHTPKSGASNAKIGKFAPPASEEDGSEHSSVGSEQGTDFESDEDIISPKRRQPVKKPKEDILEDVDLLVISTRKSRLPEKLAEQIATKWMALRKKDQSAAISQLVHAVLRISGYSAGFPEAVDDPELSAQDVTDAVEIIISKYPRDMSVYPLVDKRMKRLPENFEASLCRILVMAASEDDEDEIEELLDKIMLWLATMANVETRALRHAATLACVVIVNGLIEVLKKLDSQLTVAKRQWDAERRKERSASTRAKQLKRDEDRLRMKMVALTAYIEKVFNNIAIHRYRDVDPHIRSVTIDGLGKWACNWTPLFLDDKYLKYIGWMLNDKNPLVRSSSLSALIPLYSDANIAKSLKNFTFRFKPRLIEMVKDVDATVTEKAIELAEVLCEKDLLRANEHLAPVFMLLEKNAKIRARAALYVEKFITIRCQQDNLQDQDEMAEALFEWLVKDAFELMFNNTAPEYVLVEVIIDALWDRLGLNGLGLLSNYGVLLQYIDQPESGERGERFQLSFSRILRAVGSIICQAGEPSKSAIYMANTTLGKATKKVRTQMLDEAKKLKESLSNELQATLGRRLAAVQRNPPLFSELAVLPRFIAPEDFTKTCLSEVLRELKSSFLKYEGDLQTLDTRCLQRVDAFESPETTDFCGVLKLITETLRILSEEHNVRTVQNAAMKTVSDMIGSISKKLRRSIEDVRGGSKDRREKAEQQVQLCFSQLEALGKDLDICEDTNILEFANTIINEYRSGDSEFSDETCAAALAVLDLALVWGVKRLNEGKVSFDRLQEDVEQAFKACTGLLELPWDEFSAVLHESLIHLHNMAMLFSTHFADRPQLKCPVKVRDRIIECLYETVYSRGSRQKLREDEKARYGEMIRVASAFANWAEPEAAKAFVIALIAILGESRAFEKEIRTVLKLYRQEAAGDFWELELAALEHHFEDYLDNQKEQSVRRLEGTSREIAKSYPYGLYPLYEAALQYVFSRTSSTEYRGVFLDKAVGPLVRRVADARDYLDLLEQLLGETLDEVDDWGTRSLINVLQGTSGIKEELKESPIPKTKKRAAQKSEPLELDKDEIQEFSEDDAENGLPAESKRTKIRKQSRTRRDSRSVRTPEEDVDASDTASSVRQSASVGRKTRRSMFSSSSSTKSTPRTPQTPAPTSSAKSTSSSAVNPSASRKRGRTQKNVREISEGVFAGSKAKKPRSGEKKKATPRTRRQLSLSEEDISSDESETHFQGLSRFTKI